MIFLKVRYLARDKFDYRQQFGHPLTMENTNEYSNFTSRVYEQQTTLFSFCVLSQNV